MAVTIMKDSSYRQLLSLRSFEQMILSVVRYFERLLIGVYRKYLGVRRGRLYLSTESIEQMVKIYKWRGII